MNSFGRTPRPPLDTSDSDGVPSNRRQSKYYTHPLVARTEKSMEKVNTILKGIDTRYHTPPESLDEVDTSLSARKALLSQVDERLRRPLEFEAVADRIRVAQENHRSVSMLERGSIPAERTAGNHTVLTFGALRGFEPPSSLATSAEDAWKGLAQQPPPTSDLFYADTTSYAHVQQLRPTPANLIPATGPIHSVNAVIGTLNALLAGVQEVLLHVGSGADHMDAMRNYHGAILRVIEGGFSRVDSVGLSGSHSAEGEDAALRRTFMDTMGQIHAITSRALEASNQFVGSGEADGAQGHSCPLERMHRASGGVLQTSAVLREQIRKFQDDLDVKSNPSGIMLRSMRQKVLHEGVQRALMRDELLKYRVTARFRQNVRDKKLARANAGEAALQRRNREVDAGVGGYSVPNPTASDCVGASAGSSFITMKQRFVVCVAADDVQVIKEGLPAWCANRVVEIFCDAVGLLLRGLRVAEGTSHEGPVSLDSRFDPHHIRSNSEAAKAITLLSDLSLGRFLIAFNDAKAMYSFISELQYVLLGAPWPPEAMHLVLPNGYAPLQPIRRCDSEAPIMGRLRDEPSRNYCRYVDEFILSEKDARESAAERLREHLELQRSFAGGLASPPSLSVSRARRRSPPRVRESTIAHPPRPLLGSAGRSAVAQLQQRYATAVLLPPEGERRGERSQSRAGGATPILIPPAGGVESMLHTFIFRGLRARIGVAMGDVAIEARAPTLNDGFPDDGPETLGNVAGVHGEVLLRASLLAGLARGGEAVLAGGVRDRLAGLIEQPPSVEPLCSPARKGTDERVLPHDFFCAPLSHYGDQLSYFTASSVSQPRSLFSASNPVYSFVPMWLLHRCYHYLNEPADVHTRRMSGVAYNPHWFRMVVMGGGHVTSPHSPLAGLFREWGLFVEESCPQAMSSYLARIACPMSTAEEAQAALYAAQSMHAIAMRSTRETHRLVKRMRLLEAQQQRTARLAMAAYDMSPMSAVASLMTRLHFSGWRGAGEQGAAGVPSFVSDTLSNDVAHAVIGVYAQHCIANHLLAPTGASARKESHLGSQTVSEATNLRMALCGGWELMLSQTPFSESPKAPLMELSDASFLLGLVLSFVVAERIDGSRFADACSLAAHATTGVALTDADGVVIQLPIVWRAARLAATIAASAHSAAVHWRQWNHYVLSAAMDGQGHGPNGEKGLSLLIDPQSVRGNLSREQTIYYMRNRTDNTPGLLNMRSIPMVFGDTASDMIPLADIILHFALLSVRDRVNALKATKDAPLCEPVPNEDLTPNPGGTVLRRPGSLTAGSNLHEHAHIATAVGKSASHYRSFASLSSQLESLALLPQHRKALTGVTLSSFERLVALPGEELVSSMISLQHCDVKEGRFLLCSVEDGLGLLVTSLAEKLARRAMREDAAVVGHVVPPASLVSEQLGSAISLLMRSYEAQYALAPLFMLPIVDMGTSSKYLRPEYSNMTAQPRKEVQSPNGPFSVGSILGGPFQQALLHVVSPLAVPLVSCSRVARPFSAIQQWGAQIAHTLEALHEAGEPLGVVSTTYSLFVRDISDLENVFVSQAGALHFIGTLRAVLRGGLDASEDSLGGSETVGDGGVVHNTKQLLELLPPECITTREQALAWGQANRIRKGVSNQGSGVSGGHPCPGTSLPFVTPPTRAIEGFVSLLGSVLSRRALRAAEEGEGDRPSAVGPGSPHDPLMASDVWQFGTALFEMSTGCSLWDVLRMTKRYSGIAQHYGNAEPGGEAGAHDQVGPIEGPRSSCHSSSLVDRGHGGSHLRDVHPTNAATMAYLEAQYGTILRATEGLSGSPIFPTLVDACRVLRLASLTAGGKAVRVFDEESLWPDLHVHARRARREQAEERARETGIAETRPMRSDTRCGAGEGRNECLAIIKPFAPSFADEEAAQTPSSTPMQTKRASEGADSVLDPVVREQGISFVLLADLLRLILHVDPLHRPSMEAVRSHSFFANVPHTPLSRCTPSLSHVMLHRPTFVSTSRFEEGNGPVLGASTASSSTAALARPPTCNSFYATMAPGLASVLDYGNIGPLTTDWHVPNRQSETNLPYYPPSRASLYQVVGEGSCLCVPDSSGSRQCTNGVGFAHGMILASAHTHPIHRSRREAVRRILREEANQQVRVSSAQQRALMSLSIGKELPPSPLGSGPSIMDGNGSFRYGSAGATLRDLHGAHRCFSHDEEFFVSGRGDDGGFNIVGNDGVPPQVADLFPKRLLDALLADDR